MHISKIQQLVEWMSEADLASLELQSAEFSVRLVRPRNALASAAPVAVVDAPLAAASAVKVAAMATVCGRFLSRHPLRDQAEVSPGQRIEVGDLVGLVSVGELLLPVTATAAGIAGHFLVEDQQLVGYGTAVLALADSH